MKARSKITSLPIGGDSFSVTLKASEAEWVRNAAQARGLAPDAFIRTLVAQGRASDPSKGGTVIVTGERPAELGRAPTAA